MNPNAEFKNLVKTNVEGNGADCDFIGLSNNWLQECIRHNYAQNFTWLGRPIIQLPQDIYAIQELIWKVEPDLVIETGIAHGGSLIMSASMLALLDYCEATKNRTSVNPIATKRKVVGVDIDIRSHNREAIEAHPISHMIQLIEGSSVDQGIVEQIRIIAEQYEKVLIFLDSNHTHDHVLAELEAYAPFTSVNSYCVVWDTGVEDLPEDFCANRPWGRGNNPKTAVLEYLRKLNDQKNFACDKSIKFEIDKFIENKLMITASPDGFLKRIS